MSPTTATEEKKQAAPVSFQDDPKRFQVSKRVLLIDAVMTLFIRAGGILVIVAVVAIFVFILSQVLPLFQGAQVEAAKGGEVAALPAGNYVAVATDEWAELPMALRDDGAVFFADLAGKRGLVEKGPDWLKQGDTVSALHLNSEAGLIAAGTAGGNVHLLNFTYQPEFKGGERTIMESLSEEYSVSIAEGMEVREIAVGQSESVRLIGILVEGDGKQGFHALELKRKRGLLGTGKWEVAGKIDLTGQIPQDNRIQDIFTTNRGDALVAVEESGQVDYFYRTGDGFELRQRFMPFEDAADKNIAVAGFLQGEVSLVFVSGDGGNRVFSLLRTDADPVRKFHHTKTLENLGEPAEYYAASPRNKAFLLGGGKNVSLRFMTSEEVRWEDELPWEAQHGVIGGKYDALVFLDQERKFHKYRLDDPHPEAGVRAFFGRVWYEGSPEPKYEWQSTGGTDDFEPKLSMMPLIFGSLKGTFYAMLFSVPIALFGAMYTSEFLHPNHKVLVKPVMEIMASLPSVVLGFMAALWLAPLIEDKVPSILVALLLVPMGSFLAGWVWSTRPMSIRKWIPHGVEFLYFIPLLVLLAWAGWQLGPVLERVLFTVTDPETGEKTADFSRWWPEATGTPYEQRNSLVVGFMMGFTVIPIVFTIAEDAFSNVPGALRSGSLAMGASRWQTAWRIVLPTASAGIFSALMVGLGRAVGETMVVVMATGNTPIMEWNIFSGMRTLSANIAVELPEAPHHSTLYRTLFLGAFALFLMTFAVNTLAEVLRQHLREKFKTV